MDDQADPPTQLVELRDYRLVPGGLDAFVDHFERRFLGSQEELGMDIVGQFRRLDEPDRFVWVRRYLDAAGRAAALGRFYGGPVWAEHGPGANELMVDHTDVHLLVPDRSAPTFAVDHRPHVSRPGPPPERPISTVVAALFPVDETDALPEALTQAMDAPLGRPGDVVQRGRLVTASVPNEFPQLPVHDDTPTDV